MVKYSNKEINLLKTFNLRESIMKFQAHENSLKGCVYKYINI